MMTNQLVRLLTALYLVDCTIKCYNIFLDTRTKLFTLKLRAPNPLKHNDFKNETEFFR